MIYDKCRREENIIMQQERNVCKMVSTITIELVSFFTWVRVALRKRNPKKYQKKVSNRYLSNLSNVN